MGSHSSDCPDWPCVELEEGWISVERALAYVGQMVGRLDSLPVIVDSEGQFDGVTGLDDQLTSCTLPPRLSVSSFHPTAADDDDDDDAGRCISDACQLL